MRLLTAGLALALLMTACGTSTPKAASSTTETAPTTTIDNTPRGTATTIDKVAVGQCANDVPAKSQRVVAVLVIGCELPHIYEVYAQFKYPAGGTPPPSGAAYPGETVVRKASEQACYDQFQPWMGVAWTESNYDIQTWFPSAASWTATSDRKVTCGAFLMSGKRTTGSMKGKSQ